MWNLLAETVAETETRGEAVLKALGVFWKGMLAIAIVIAIIIVVTLIMNAIDSSVQKKKAAKKAAEEESPQNNTPEQ